MSEEIQQKLEELVAQLELQKLKIASLEEITTSASTRNGPSLPANPSGTTTAKFDASRVPDAIKLITPYGGDPKTLYSWLTSVESKFDFAKKLCPTPEEATRALPLWHSIIRDKVVDKANDVLVQNHTPTEWLEIKRTLEEYFGDKRDLCTLITKINNLQQNSKTIEDFYSECRELLADITAKIMLDQEMRNCAKTLTTNHECMITNAFIDGLNEPYSTLVRVSRPKNLNEARQGAMEQYNAAQRKKEKHTKAVIAPQKTAFKPAMQHPNTWQNNRFPVRPHFSQLPFRQQFNQPFRQQFNQPTFRTQPNFQQPRPVNPPNTNQPPLAIKQEPASHQMRMPYKPFHNVNLNEVSQTSANFSPYEDYCLQPEYEQEYGTTEQNNDPSDTDENQDVNFCMDLDLQTKE